MVETISRGPGAGGKGDIEETYPDPTATRTATATVSETPYVFTKTWPSFPQPTGSTEDGDSSESKFPNPEYVRLLDASFMFYEAQRSGKLPSDQRVSWGYYDAGDYIKFSFPLTFTLTEICYGGLEFFDGYILSNQTQYLDQMLRWGLDWLIKAHPNNNTFYVQVGISEVDNNYWGPDTGIPTPRPSFFVSDTRPGTDVTADAAAAFAACSILYRQKLNDTAYATNLQSHAEVLYGLAETAQPQQVYQNIVQAAACCYPSTGFFDELAWGAAWMYRMSRDPIYLEKVSRYINSYQLSSPIEAALPVTWDDKAGLVYILMAQLTRGTSDGSKWQNMAEQFAEFTISAVKPCVFTPGGMYYCYGYSGEDSLVVMANAALAMNLLAYGMEGSITTATSTVVDRTTREKIEKYKSFALKQVRYILGENPEKTPYVVGIHPNSPVNPHSALAAGGTSTGAIDTYPPQEEHVLLGGVVGGPDRNDRFLDRRSNWRQSEVALDYNAPFTTLMAYQVMTSHEPPPYVTAASSTQPSPDAKAGGLKAWQIALIVIFALLVLPGLGVFIYLRKRNQIREWFTARKTAVLDSPSESNSTMTVGTKSENKDHTQKDATDSGSSTRPSTSVRGAMGSNDTLHTIEPRDAEWPVSLGSLQPSLSEVEKYPPQDCIEPV
ncbi:hypothetical protein BGX28_009314 [Mortierella sp. GBA30]|nr:hypothetical protein BGX28_009314 [Mortierella sp. GBA30]